MRQKLGKAANRAAARFIRIGSVGLEDSAAASDRLLRVEPALDWMTVAFHANVGNAATVQRLAPGGSGPVVDF